MPLVLLSVLLPLPVLSAGALQFMKGTELEL